MSMLWWSYLVLCFLQRARCTTCLASRFSARFLGDRADLLVEDAEVSLVRHGPAEISAVLGSC